MGPQNNPVNSSQGTAAPWNPTRQQLDQLEQILQRMLKDQQTPGQSTQPNSWQQGGPGFPPVQGNPSFGSFPGQPYPPSFSGNPGPGYTHTAPPAFSQPSQPFPGNHQAYPGNGPSTPQSGGPNPNPQPGNTWNPGPGSWNPSSTTWGPLAESWKQNPGGFPSAKDSAPSATGSGSGSSPSFGLANPTGGNAAMDRSRVAPIPTAPEVPQETGLTWLLNFLVDLPLSLMGPPGRFFMGPTGRFLVGTMGMAMISYAGLIVASDWLDWSWADQLLPWQIAGRLFPAAR